MAAGHVSISLYCSAICSFYRAPPVGVDSPDRDKDACALALLPHSCKLATLPVSNKTRQRDCMMVEIELPLAGVLNMIFQS